MSLRVTRETSCGRSFAFSDAFATASLTVAALLLAFDVASWAEK
jgi:hypothetical protein